MSKGMEDVRVIKDIRINVLTGQVLSNTIKKARERYKEDLKCRFFF